MTKKLAATAILSMLASAFGCGDGDSPSGPDASSSAALSMLSLTEAPASTRTFFWGNIDVTAPGFVGPPRDEMTIGIGPDNSLRYLSWKTLPMLPKTFGESAHEFPLSGSRSVDLTPEFTDKYTATVLDASAPNASHFLLREHVVTDNGYWDYIESAQGTKTPDGWSVVYADEGKIQGTTISAHGQGMLYPGDPNAVAPAAGEQSLWSAPVELSAPGFVGPPVDHLFVSLDGKGQIRGFAFQNFSRGTSYTGTKQAFALIATPIEEQGTVRFDPVVSNTAEHFVIRYQVKSTDSGNDFTEGLDGTRQGNTLVIRYFITGKLWGVTVDAHAAGTLVPASVGTGR